MIFFTALGLVVFFLIMAFLFMCLGYTIWWSVYCLKEWFRYMSFVPGPSTIRQKWKVYELIWIGYKVVEDEPEEHHEF